MNCRLTVDLDGKLTSYQRTGAGTVDYGIASEELLKSILGFQVQTLTPYSDHCPISVKIPFSKSGSMNNKSNKEPVRQTKKTPTVQNTPKTFLWKTGSKEKFMSALSSTDIQDQLESFNAKDYPPIDDEISHFNKLMMHTAKISLVPSKKKWKHTKNSKPWYDNTCIQLKKQLQQLAKKMNPATHRSLQQEYFGLKKKYKKEVKLMHKKYKNDLINEIDALSSEHSQDVWRQINKLRKESTVEEETLISPEAWIQHFRQLLYDSNETNENTNFANDSDETENLSDDEILGKPITPKEIHEHISKLKTKKASSMDSILNEMIKHGRYFLLPSLEKIFNDILNSGKFPTE